MYEKRWDWLKSRNFRLLNWCSWEHTAGNNLVSVRNGKSSLKFFQHLPLERSQCQKMRGSVMLLGLKMELQSFCLSLVAICLRSCFIQTGLACGAGWIYRKQSHASCNFRYWLAFRFSTKSKRSSVENSAVRGTFWPATKFPVPVNGPQLLAGSRRTEILPRHSHHYPSLIMSLCTAKCWLAPERISSAEQTSLGPVWVGDIHSKLDAKPAVPRAQQHSVNIKSLLQLWWVQVWQSSLLDDFLS